MGRAAGLRPARHERRGHAKRRTRSRADDSGRQRHPMRHVRAGAQPCRAAEFRAGDGMSARVVAIVQHKGGSGKTTTAVNLAAALAECGERVLLVDADAQGTATEWAAAAPSAALAAVYLDGAPLADAVVPSRWAGVDVAPSSPFLRDASLAARPLAVMMLRQAVAALPARWTWVVVDTPPAAGIVSLSAAMAAAWVVVPCEASSVALAGVRSVLDTLEDARGALAPASGPRLAGILITRHDARTRAAAAVARVLRAELAADVFASTIRETVRHREAAALGRTILEHDPNGAGAVDYRAAAAELIERTNRP